MNIITQAKEDRMTFDKEVNRALKQISAMDVHSEEYEAAVKNLKVLCEARGIKTNRSISMDTVIAAGTNILGIILVLQWEQVHVVTSKAFSLVFRGGRG